MLYCVVYLLCPKESNGKSLINRCRVILTVGAVNKVGRSLTVARGTGHVARLGVLPALGVVPQAQEAFSVTRKLFLLLVDRRLENGEGGI